MDNKMPQVKILRDFVASYADAEVSNTSSSSASQDERCGGIKLPGIFPHPVNRDDSILRYSVDKEAWHNEQGSIFLLFRVGMRDGIPWGAKKNTPNGARFSIHINGEIVFGEDLAESAWKARAIDMTPWLGVDTVIEFRTNAIDSDTNYDWCVFGQPMLVSFAGTSEHASMPENTVGIALAEIQCEEASKILLTMGDVSEPATIQPGKHWIPLHFTQIEHEHVRLVVESGRAELLSVAYAPYMPQLEVAGLVLDSPLANANMPFRVLLELKNDGLGVYHDNETAILESIGSDSLSGRSAGEKIAIGEIAPGKEKTIIWDELIANKPGAYEILAHISEKASPSLHFHVFPPEPQLPSQHAEASEIVVTLDKDVKAIVANGCSRITLITDGSSEGYGIAETWDGALWKRVGSIYPLADVVLRDKRGNREALKLKIVSFTTSEDKLIVKARTQGKDGQIHPMTITYVPEANAPRIHVKHQLLATDDIDVMAFYGTNILAGHGSFGVKKDFAIFPGLEYLESDEESSSERDLAYPLNIREVPATHKIATPLMAVQAQGSLISLMWNSNQEWAIGEEHPAARFLAPRFDSGYSHIRMSLFAPSVGEYVTENEYEASKPYTMTKGENIQLDACLVLDHKVNYIDDKVVCGSHKGGLILKSMQHWFDVYGLPEPSEQPRDWESERALCRDAYFNAVWSEDPTGWRHCHGWQPGLFVGHSVPLILDMKAGVGNEARKEIERRINLVVSRATEQHGKGYLWTNAACHIMLGELPFYYGYLGESLKGFRNSAHQRLAGRENGLWVWHPQSKKHESLGISGDHTLGQAASNAFFVLRAARLSGDRELIVQALDAIKQMELYEVPRGAQMWECPMYQPDILAAGYAIRAYCEAYRLTYDERYLEHARYWGMTGLPFIYMWSLDGYPTMLYNVISVIGSTFYTHSWLGLPVVWCGLVYAYGLLDLSEFDDYFDWRRIAQGIVNSTMWQQYTDGPSKGCYPDSWNMIRSKPNPADINPENILVNEFRLRGLSPEPRCIRFEGRDGFTFLNSGGDITNPSGSIGKGRIDFRLSGIPGFPVYSILAPVPEPTSVNGQSISAANSDDLQEVSDGWLYDADLQAIIMKSNMTAEYVDCRIQW